MRKFWSTLVLLALAATLTGCGGSDNAPFVQAGGGADSSAPPVNSTVAKLTVTSTSPTISSDGSSSAAIIVVAKDANNVAIKGAVVKFAATAGTLQVDQGTTDATGTAIAVLSAAGLPAGNTITVTASIGSATGSTALTVSSTQQTLTLLTSAAEIPSDGSAPATITALVRDANNNVVAGVPVNFQASAGSLTVTQGTTDASGAAVATLATAGDKSNRTITVSATAGSSSATVKVLEYGTTLSVLSGPTSLVLGATGNYAVALADFGKNGISGQTITLQSANGNTVTPASGMTDQTGQLKFTVKAVNSGNDTITATALGATGTVPVVVSSESLSFTQPTGTQPVSVNVGTPQQIEVTWLSGGGTSGNISFSATRGTLAAATTVNGVATTSISSTDAGLSTVTATAPDGVTTQLSINFVPTTATQVTVQANPSSIPVNSSSTIIATVRDGTNNLVPNQQVNFNLSDVTGGTLSVSQATTNSQGQATIEYVAPGAPSATNGVVITATLLNGTSAQTTLTVGGQAFRITLGTGALVTPLDATTYQLPYSVYVADANGNAVSGANVTFTATPLAFVQGGRVFANGSWGTVSTTTSADPHAFAQATLYGDFACANEDTNNNGIFDGTDYNGKGQFNLNTNNTDTNLYPGSVVTLAGSPATTSAAGEATVQLTYPRDHAYYVAVQLTATVTTGAGTQNTATAVIWLPGLASDFNDQTKAAPGPVSPYGQATICGDPNYPH